MNNEKSGNEERTGSVLAGLFLLLIGIGFFFKQTMSADFPSWIMSWPMLMIAAGIFSGLKNGFRGAGWIVLIGVGSVFLVDRIIPGVNLKPYVWPLIIIAVGLVMIFGTGSKKKKCFCGLFQSCKKNRENISNNAMQYNEQYTNDGEDFINSTAILGGSKKIIFSKNFKGGDITNFMGGAEINCSQADINGKVKLDITQIFGGTKIIVPPHWTIQSTATSLFAGFEDKRVIHANATDPNKILVIDGLSIFGAIEIKSY
jgi:predicted membrane protein